MITKIVAVVRINKPICMLEQPNTPLTPDSKSLMPFFGNCSPVWSTHTLATTFTVPFLRYAGCYASSGHRFSGMLASSITLVKLGHGEFCYRKSQLLIRDVRKRNLNRIVVCSHGFVLVMEFHVKENRLICGCGCGGYV
ncbi:hypothetical protein Tco_0265819 [Tanacetum coccineum]